MEPPGELPTPSTPTQHPARRAGRCVEESPPFGSPSASIPALMVEIDDGMMEPDDEHYDEDPMLLREREALWHRNSYGTSVYPSRASYRDVAGSFDTETVYDSPFRLSRLWANSEGNSVSTRSLYESDIEYRMENGRRYVLNYFMPNDEDEQLRQQILHQVFLFLFDSKLTTAPLFSPTKILDVGTGTGEWAMDIGEAFPKADVTGTDISAIQPSAVPSNVLFEIFDAEDDVGWTYAPNLFDLIHFRTMSGCFSCWDLIYQRAYTHLKPGGWIELIDFDNDQDSGFLSYFAPDSEVHTWRAAMRKASAMYGMDLYPAYLKPERLAIQGFTDIQISSHTIPLGSWPADLNIRSMVKLWLVAVLAGLEASSMRLLTKELGWEADEVRRVCNMISSELMSTVLNKEKVKDMSVAIKVTIARKPLEPERQSRDPELSAEEFEGEPKRRKISLEKTWQHQEFPGIRLRDSAHLHLSSETPARGPPQQEPLGFSTVVEGGRYGAETASEVPPRIPQTGAS